MTHYIVSAFDYGPAWTLGIVVAIAIIIVRGIRREGSGSDA
jgi:hypothetical protein